MKHFRYKEGDVYTKIPILIYNFIILYFNKRVALATFSQSFLKKFCILFIIKEFSFIPGSMMLTEMFIFFIHIYVYNESDSFGLENILEE